jgi:sterol desaturase/sphingolipid hydroxylase (fatty acid hydroxylase superfamily)
MDVSPRTLRLAALLAGLILLLTMETLRPRRAWHAPRGRRLLFHGGIAAFNTALLQVAWAGPLAALVVTVRERGWGLAGLLRLSGPAEILLSLIVLDLLDYLWHRANHVVPFLWRFHSVHHVDTHVDVTTSLRFHPGELLLSGAAKSIWIVVWGPSLGAFAIFEVMITAAAQFHHGNIDLPDRVEPAVRLLGVTPRMHASHHSAGTRSLDANFATIFSIWDRILGSYVEPTAVHLVEQGLWFGRDSDLSLAYLLTLPLAAPVPRPEAP